MSTNCTLQIAAEVDALNAGGIPFPIFFRDAECGNNQWPEPGETLQESFRGSQGFVLRTQACPGAGSPEKTVPPTELKFSDCPLPLIRSVIVPSDISLKFYAYPTTNGRIKDPGKYLMNKTTNNIWKINDSSRGSNNDKWGTSQQSGTSCATNNNYPADPYFQNSNVKIWWDATKQLKISNLSCDQPFWPSLAGVYGDLRLVPGQEAYQIQRGFCGVEFPNSIDFEGFTTGSGSLASYFTGNRVSKTCTGVGINTSGDCVPPFDGFRQLGSLAPQGCVCPIIDNCNPCICQEDWRIYGNVDKVSITFTGGNDWTSQQVEYCTGRQLSLGGIPVNRYGNGTLACDPIMEQLCQNTAALTANPAYQKACTCILEQKRLDVQFDGLNLPVQCFTDVCAEDDPGVYKTTNQSQGCSARLCEQIVNINGSAIASEGFQSITCDGEKINISGPTTSVSTVPIVSPDFGQSGINLGPTFFVALGLLILMVVLLVAWGIRQYVLNRRAKQIRKAQLVNVLDQTLSSGL